MEKFDTLLTDDNETVDKGKVSTIVENLLNALEAATGSGNSKLNQEVRKNIIEKLEQEQN